MGSSVKGSGPARSSGGAPTLSADPTLDATASSAQSQLENSLPSALMIG